MREGGPRRIQVEMKNVDPQALAEAKAALEASRNKEVERVENLTEEELAAELRAGEIVRQHVGKKERKPKDLAELGGSDLEPASANIELAEEVGNRYKNNIVAKNEHRTFDQNEERARKLKDALSIVEAYKKAGEDPEVLRSRFEAALETAEEQMADIEDQGDLFYREAQSKIEVTKAQLQELDRLVAQGWEAPGQQAVA
ncbi:MAG: hypothetical protein AAB776_03220 [Patescibacteria group bacterium]